MIDDVLSVDGIRAVHHVRGVQPQQLLEELFLAHSRDFHDVDPHDDQRLGKNDQEVFQALLRVPHHPCVGRAAWK